jgi:hypothetical protein
VSLGLTEPWDVASFAAASKRCAAVVQRAPLRVALTVRLSSPSEEQRAARRKLQALCASWPGAAELDARGLELGDGDVQAALAELPSLQVLHLSGCKKLTPALPAALAQSPPRQLHSITLQRCFQLTAGALSDVLAAAARPGACLSSAALSHLSLGAWPGPGASLPCCQLRMLALHNCGKVGVPALRGIAAACPRLEVLMLGGACFALEAAALDAPPPCGNAAPAASVASWPELDGGEAAHLWERALAAVMRGEPPPHGGAHGWAAYVAGVAAQLALLVRALPGLQELELTFGPPGVVAALQHLAATEVRLAGAAGGGPSSRQPALVTGWCTLCWPAMLPRPILPLPPLRCAAPVAGGAGAGGARVGPCHPGGCGHRPGLAPRGGAPPRGGLPSG